VTASSGSAFPRPRMLILFLVVVAIAVYANSAGNGFVMDDSSAITSNTIVQKGFAGIPELLHTPYHQGYSVVANDLYRPLSLVLFAVEYQLFGLNPVPGHVVNLLLFVGCVLLLFLFLDQLFEQKKTGTAFIAALLFALHPIHTDVVDNIKGGDELLCFFFAFLSLNIYIKYAASGKPIQLLAGSFSLFMALLSKETAITFLAVIPLVFFFYKNEDRKRSTHILAGAVLAAGIFLTIRFSVLSAYHVNQLSEHAYIKNELAMQGLGFESRVATAVLMLGQYVQLLLLPYPLLCDYSAGTVPFVHFSDPLVLLSLAFYLFIGIVGIRRLLNNRKDPYAFGILFFLITISLFSNILFLTGATMAERFLFFPSVGFCIVAAMLIDQWVGKSAMPVYELLRNPKVLGAAGAICLCYAVITVNRNGDWKNNFILFSTDLKKAPHNCRLNFFVGNILLNTPAESDQADEKAAVAAIIPYFNTALATCPDYGTAQFELGTAYATLERYDSAVPHLERSLKIEPDNVACIGQLGRAYFMTKKYQPSVEAYKRANTLAPGNLLTNANLGLSYLYAGNSDSAIYYGYRAMALDPGFAGSYQILARAYTAKGNVDSAGKYEGIAQRNTPGYKL